MQFGIAIPVLFHVPTTNYVRPHSKKTGTYPGFFVSVQRCRFDAKNRMMLYSYNDRSSEPLHNGSSIATKIGRIDVSSLCKNGRKAFYHMLTFIIPCACLRIFMFCATIMLNSYTQNFHYILVISGDFLWKIRMCYTCKIQKQGLIITAPLEQP